MAAKMQKPLDGGTVNTDKNVTVPEAQTELKVPDTAQTMETTTTSSTTTTGGTSHSSYDRYTPYAEDPSVAANRQALLDWMKGQPTDYESKYNADIETLVGQILGRPQWSYDPGTDQVYQAYRQDYAEAGRQAQRNAQANAAALSGGYGSSYGATAGAQAYANTYGQLAGVLANQQQLSQQAYQMEGDNLAQKLSSLMSAENLDYGEWQGAYDRWAGQRDYLAGRYDTEAERDFQKWAQNIALGGQTTRSSQSHTVTNTTTKPKETANSTGSTTTAKSLTTAEAGKLLDDFVTHIEDRGGKASADSIADYIADMLQDKRIDAQTAKRLMVMYGIG